MNDISMQARVKQDPAHWTVRLFAGPDTDSRAMCGVLVMRPDEALELLAILEVAGHEVVVVTP
jgi:hypothetical protein